MEKINLNRNEKEFFKEPKESRKKKKNVEDVGVFLKKIQYLLQKRI